MPLTVFQPHVRFGDPHVCSDDRHRLSLHHALYESLVCRDRQGTYRPALAQSWTLQEDARTWTFSLRTPLPFHNGDSLQAQDVIASLERARDPALGGELGTQGVYQSYLEGARFTALDAHTVRIVTAEPMADLLDLLVDIPVVPERVLVDLPERAVGSGPYRLVEASDTRVVMDAFTAYWGGQPAFKRVVWQAEADEEERVQALLAGEADLIAAVSPAGRHLIESTAQRKIITRESHVCVIFMCNALTGVCTDRRVRQALNYALDVPLIIDTIREGAAQPLNGPLTPFHLGYDPHTPPYPYDPERARALLAGAGYGDGLPLLIDVPTVLPDEATELAQCMVEQYARVGIFAEVRVFADRPGYADLVRAKQMDDLCCFDSSPLSTYRVLREKFHSGVRGPWWQGYTNPEVDRLIDQARATVNDTQRQELYRRAYRLLRDDAPWVFLYRPTLFWGASPQVPDWTIGRDGLIRLVAAPDRMK